MIAYVLLSERQKKWVKTGSMSKNNKRRRRKMLSTILFTLIQQ